MAGSNQEPSGEQPEVLALIRAFNDVLILAEPHIFRLYNATGLTVMQLRILRLLREGPTQAGRLAELVAISAPSLTRILKRVEELGLASRKVDPVDRRRIEIAITRRGLSLLALQPLLKGSAFERAAVAMTSEERTRAITTLRDLGDRVRAHGKGSPRAVVAPQSKGRAGKA